MKENKINKNLINSKINYENISQEDINILNNNILFPNINNFFKNYSSNEYAYKIKDFQEILHKKTNFIKNIEFTKQTDSIFSSNNTINMKFIHKQIYMNPIEYFYYLKPNAIRGCLNYNIEKLKNESSIGVEYNQRRNKQSFFLQNVTYMNNNNELLLKYGYAKREDDFKRKSNTYTTKIKLIHNFLKRPHIFKNFFLFDPRNRFSLILSHRNINNYFDEVAVNTNEKQNSVNEIVINLPEHDSTFNLKFLYEKNILYHKNIPTDNKNVYYENNKMTKCSYEVINSLNTLYSRTKIFLRRLFYINPKIQMQCNIETAFLFNLKNFYHAMKYKLNKEEKLKNDDYKIHEKLYVYNFKGILNPSKKCQFLGNNKVLHSYMLGNVFYSLLNNKIIFKKIPIFNSFEMQKDGFEISPYLHFNGLVTVSKFDKFPSIKNMFNISKQLDNRDNNLIRMSSGLGVIIISKLFSFEIIYTPYVKKSITDIHSKFTVKFGID